MGKKDIYTGGEYSRFFSPESAAFPFAKTYAEKRTLILERLEGGGQSILDLGGGRGRFSIPLSRNNRVCMADLSLQMIQEALAAMPGAQEQPAGGDLQFVCCDAGLPPFQPDSFDVLLAIDLLPHLCDPERSFRTIWELLKPGGTAIIDNSNRAPLWMFSYPEYVNWRTHPIKFVRTFINGGILPDWAESITHLSKGEFTALLAGAGFTICDFIELGPAVCPKWHLAFCRKPTV
jgi:ubiquinone/menaquinone biosynthesis C-methylase UbiE